MLGAPPEEMTYASAPPNFSDELDAARDALTKHETPTNAPPPAQYFPPNVATSLGFVAMPPAEEFLATEAVPAPTDVASLPTSLGFGAMPPAADEGDRRASASPPALFSAQEDTGATAIFRDPSRPDSFPSQAQGYVPPPPPSSEPVWEQRKDPLTSTAPIPSLASRPPMQRPATPMDAMFAPAASPPRNRSQPAPSELGATEQARAIRVETAASFEPQNRAFVADQELVWRPGMTGMNHVAMPQAPSHPPQGAQRSSRPDAGRQRSLAFTDNEFWDPQRPASQTLADTDALEAHLQKPKSRLPLPFIIGGVLVVVALGIVIVAVAMN